MAAYFDGQHHPQHALSPRTGYVALVDERVIAYVAGHLTERHGCDGELQYLFVAPAFRRMGIARELVRMLAKWFETQQARKICVGVANDSALETKPFVEALGAVPLRRHWYAWQDIGRLLRQGVRYRRQTKEHTP